ncbi:MAG: hypothetical protein HC881_10165 [Leptolyngbyaceae cyanobacterium SL_7_1]|nr:hypothetical protein [Leptolyngbyaceae cyanobacterium SL_7_1]
MRVDGSPSMTVINESLKRRFEERYDETTVELASGGTNEALQALINDDIDLAAIGRPLTPEERAEGLVEYPINREKIAIIVGPDNPFTGNLTFAQFAQIFRGEIQDWSEVGGTAGPIRFVDRPETSDTRQAFRNYPVFQAAPFEAGDNAEAVADDTAVVIDALGTDGIGYAIYSQVENQPNVRIVPMHQTLPDNPAYPFSQPRGYVYRSAATLAAPVLAFLGFASAPEGQEAIAEAVQEEAAAVTPASPAPTAESPAAPPVESPTASPDAVATAPVEEERGGFPWWWLLLLPLLAVFGWLFGRRRAKRRCLRPLPRLPRSPVRPLPRLLLHQGLRQSQWHLSWHLEPGL